MKRISRSWKDNTNTRDARRYGKRNETKYETPFMVLDTEYLETEIEDEEV